MEINLLDVGQTKYGDCLLIRRGDRKILIDAAHPGDFNSIVEQLKKLLGQDPPFNFDLIVVTHCHLDHIGCMPKLVSNDVITGKFALVADEKFGWGRDADGDSAIDAVESLAARKLLLAIQEEPADDLDDDALAQFIEDSATLESQYIQMLAKLEADGTTVVRYGRDAAESVKNIEEEFADFGLKVLGPTPEHLAICAAAIAGNVTDTADSLRPAAVADDAASLVTAYRSAVKNLAQKNMALSDDAAIEDRPGVGAAKNDQSIVISLEADGWRALLTGDMQFAEPEVSNLDSYMSALLDEVMADGAYDFIKLAHHASYNGIDEDVLERWKDTRLFAHTGGRKDPGHPDAGTLKLLKERARTLKFARTDKNGIISVRKVGGKLQLIAERGELNNFSKNRSTGAQRDEIVESSTSGQLMVESSSVGSDVVQVITRVPHVNTRVTITIEVEPGEKKKTELVAVQPKTDIENKNTSTPRSPPNGPSAVSPASSSDGVKLGGGRTISERLLFVVNRSKLIANVGEKEATIALKAIADAGQHIVELPPATSKIDDAVAMVRAEIKSNKYVGVVIVGGYDVVPSARLDVLDAKLRTTLEGLGLVGRDSDGFVVWSDTLYGDIDGDTVAELPVSRIPDARNRDVLLNALQSPAANRGVRGGVRNAKRPFADAVYQTVSAKLAANMVICEPDTLFDFKPPLDVTSDVYFMLHGSNNDTSRFWGEDAAGQMIEAVEVTDTPKSAPGAIVFCGCCWGALTVAQTAAKLRDGVELRPRLPESSIAISYLKAGALAFVGCTGTHYSPLKPTPPAGLNFFGKPMHDAFWANINAGKRPAQALFDAKVKYAKSMPHGPDDPFSRAVEMKILREFTVLGLGW